MHWRESASDRAQRAGQTVHHLKSCCLKAVSASAWAWKACLADRPPPHCQPPPRVGLGQAPAWIRRTRPHQTGLRRAGRRRSARRRLRPRARPRPSAPAARAAARPTRARRSRRAAGRPPCQPRRWRAARPPPAAQPPAWFALAPAPKRAVAAAGCHSMLLVQYLRAAAAAWARAVLSGQAACRRAFPACSRVARPGRAQLSMCRPSRVLCVRRGSCIWAQLFTHGGILLSMAEREAWRAAHGRPCAAACGRARQAVAIQAPRVGGTFGPSKAQRQVGCQG